MDILYDLTDDQKRVLIEKYKNIINSDSNEQKKNKKQQRLKSKEIQIRSRDT